jgi:hypothetical protein
MQTPRASFYLLLALLSISCTVSIKDETFCALVPGNNGAICDNFLTANQQILDEAQWQALQMTWQNQGQATECTQSDTVGDIKAEIEKLCALAPCTYEIKKAQKKILKVLSKMQRTAQFAIQ